MKELTIKYYPELGEMKGEYQVNGKQSNDVIEMIVLANAFINVMHQHLAQASAHTRIMPGRKMN